MSFNGAAGWRVVLPVRPVRLVVIVVIGVVVAALIAGAGAGGLANAEPGLADYRTFRALSIDLAGRMPTRAEVEAFGQPSFDLDGWIESHLDAPGYAERLRRVYMDLLRLEIGPSFQFVPPTVTLRRETVIGPDGKEVFVYYRKGQRRRDPATDGDFCLPDGGGKPLPAIVLEHATVTIKPWWLYADASAENPADRFGDGWAQRFPGYSLVPALTVEPDGKTPTTAVRICREESQAAEYGLVYASGRAAVKPGTPPPPGRKTPPPPDSGFAKTHAGRLVSCMSATGFQNSVECGCGPSLERCLPGAGAQFDPPAFILPTHTPLGADQPFELSPQAVSSWSRFWWGQEAVRFLDDLFLQDRDFREILTGRATLVNGPLAQFYKFIAPATCCGPGQELDYTTPEALVEPAKVPPLLPEDTATWVRIPDRGPHASGLLTMPIFLTKYGSRRARAHAVYGAFLCKDFVAENLKLEPSTEPNLMKRPGCQSCHTALEPMAAYFTRIAESDWTWLPPAVFPLVQPRCSAKTPPGFCKTAYDPALGQLRAAYASPAHAERGPAGLAEDIVTSPDFAPCVAKQVAQSFLGRALTVEDDGLIGELAKSFIGANYRMRALVRTLVRSDAYRRANDLRGAP